MKPIEQKDLDVLIKNKEIRKIIRLWTKVNDVVGLTYNADENSLTDIFRNEIHFNEMLGLEDGCFYTTKELCGGVGRMTEPLIKDEKIRKAVRAWAEANNINSGHYYDNDMKFNSSEHKFTWINTGIQFNGITGLENLKHGKRYTIVELCGEEEE